MDFTRIIPEYLLVSDRLKQLIEAVQEWFEDHFVKTTNLLRSYDTNPPERDFLDYSTDLVGWTDVTDIVLEDFRADLLRFSNSAWKIAGSYRFWDLALTAVGAKFAYQHQADRVVEYSSGKIAWDYQRYQDADYYREASFITNLTTSDMASFEYLKEWFPAGCYLYYIIKWEVEGSKSYIFVADERVDYVNWKLYEYDKINNKLSHSIYEVRGSEIYTNGAEGVRHPALSMRHDSSTISV